MSPRPIRYLVLWLTTACNLRCGYCYRGDQPALAMPLDVARSVLQLVAASGLPFHVQMAGGEPTLEPALIDAVGQMVRRAGWPATLAVQTNGTLMDPSLVECCRRHGISLGISLDGPPGVQERIRGGAGATFKGLGLLARHDVPVRVTTVVSSANVDHLGELMLTLATFPNVRAVGLDPVVLRGGALRMRDPSPDDAALRSGVTEMLAMHHRVNLLRREPIIWREREAVSQALKQGKTEGVFCHACRGESLAVHPDGSVSPCGQTAGHPALATGTLERIDWEKLGSLFRGVQLRGPCRRCPLEGRCPGDCPSRLAADNGAGTSTMCLIYRTVMEQMS
jgi:uncharacterized protein